MITENQKKDIADLLQAYVSQKGSQNKAARSLKDVSPATVSHMLKEHCWFSVADTMWRNVGAQLGYRSSNWNVVDTANYIMLNEILTDSQIYSNTMAIVSPAGSSKSSTCRQFAKNGTNVFLLECSEYWNRKSFLQELMRELGRDSSGMNITELMRECLRQLKVLNNPIIILDEADKLTDQVLVFFITLYNNLEDHCGIILIATNHLEKKLKKGLSTNKRGYQEIYSRIGRRFVELPGVNPTDITKVCHANGVTSKVEIKNIIERSEYDLRRVRRMIHAINRRNEELKKHKKNEND